MELSFGSFKNTKKKTKKQKKQKTKKELGHYLATLHLTEQASVKK